MKEYLIGQIEDMLANATESQIRNTFFLVKGFTKNDIKAENGHPEKSEQDINKLELIETIDSLNNDKLIIFLLHMVKKFEEKYGF